MTAMLTGIFLLLQTVAIPTSSAVSRPTRTFIIAFKYAAIEANAQRSINAPSAKPQLSRQSSTSKPTSFPVKRYLQLTASMFEAEKRGVLNAFPSVRVIQNYAMLPVAAVRATASAAALLASDPRIVSVTPVESYALQREVQQREASPTSAAADLKVIDDVEAQANGDLGEGTAVAVLDDGTDYTNPAFGTCPPFGLPGCNVLAYKDFAKAPTSGLSFDGHGTNVAGQVLKVAPQTGLVIGNVFHESKGQVSATDTAILNGLNWVLSEAAAYQATNAIRAVNMSLGNPFTYSVSTCNNSPYAAVFSQLVGADIQPVLAAGNTAYDGTKFKIGIDAPACTADALAVGAVYDKNIGKRIWDQTFSNGKKSDCTDKTTAPDKIACFSQGGPLVDIVAPGVNETAAGVTDTGTSQATPLVSGAIAALASGAMSVSSSQIAAAIIGFGKTITDNRTKETVESLDVTAAELNLYGGAVIQSGNVGMGITQWGDLNVANQAPSAQGTATYGLRYLPTDNEFAGPGCPCEGWGVADSISGADGYADEYTGTSGLNLVSFTHSATTATSEVTIGTAFDVTNAYSPVPGVPDLFQDQVTIENISGATLGDVVYRRLVDWDMEPTAFDEYVTVEGYGNSPALVGTTNDGFDSADPLSASDNLGATGNFVQYGPLDQGAQFNFDFGSLAAGSSITFTEFYGAADNQSDSYNDLAAVGAEAYSLGEPSSSTDGTPNTAILGFSGIGGSPLTYPPSP